MPKKELQFEERPRGWLSTLLANLFFRRTVAEPQRANTNDVAEVDPSAEYKLRLENLQKAHSALKLSSSSTDTRLHGLEEMLRDKDLRHTALLYYQLNVLWEFCHEQLAIHQKHLIKRYEEEERIKLLEKYKVEQERESKYISSQISQLDKARLQLEVKKFGTIQDINSKKRFWYFFVRRELKNKLDEEKTELAPLEKKLADSKTEQARIAARQAPRLKALSVKGKRSVNANLIAFAQFCFVNLLENNVGNLALWARDNAPGELNFGAPDKCQELEQFINDRKDKIEGSPGIAKLIEPQALRVISQAKFSGDSETVPAKDSVAFTLSLGSFDPSQPGIQDSDSTMTNILREDYWDIHKLFLR